LIASVTLLNDLFVFAATELAVQRLDGNTIMGRDKTTDNLYLDEDGRV
jgi:hypothetical protein